MNPFSRYLPALEAEMRRALETPPRSPDLLYGMLRYHLGWVDAEFRPTHAHAGKRLRPIFLLLSCEAQAGAWHQALPAAAAVELLHNFSLIHDDIEDRDVLRRGRPTLWTVWPEAQALNAGDALFAIAYRTLAGLQVTGVPPDRMLAAQKRYLDACISLTEGQCRDLAFETMESVTLQSYLQMVEDKTAALLGLACALGGLIAGAAEARIEALEEFGINLGLSFQMQDDLLGLWGDPERTGKPVGADLRQRKKTLPILHGLKESAELRALIGRPKLDEADVAEAQALLVEMGSREYTEERARDYHRQAMEAFERTESSGEAAEALRALAGKLLNRDK